MGLNIKNATVERLAKELAAETGESNDVGHSDRARGEAAHGCAANGTCAEKIRRIDADARSLGPDAAGRDERSFRPL